MKGITFIQPLFVQVVKGLKTMTRRTIKLQYGIDCKNHVDFCGKIYYGKPTKLTINEDGILACTHCNQIGIFKTKPRYKIGEIVYLKEPYMVTSCKKIASNKYEATVEYKYIKGCRKIKLSEKYVGVLNKWKSPRFMPEWASRYKVKITNVSVQQIEEISESDCVKEGVESIIPRMKAKSIKSKENSMPLGYSRDTYFRDYTKINSESKKQDYPTFRFKKAKDSFITLWNVINGKTNPYHSNPHVFVYTFKIKSKN